MFESEIMQVPQRCNVVIALAQSEIIDQDVACGESSSLDDTPEAPKAEFRGVTYTLPTYGQGARNGIEPF